MFGTSLCQDVPLVALRASHPNRESVRVRKGAASRSAASMREWSCNRRSSEAGSVRARIQVERRVSREFDLRTARCCRTGSELGPTKGRAMLL